MNYLQLCQRMIREAGISGVSSFTSTVGVTGEAQRVTDWISTAWTEIQGKCEDWGFMRASYLNPTGPAGQAIPGTSFPTVSGQSAYPLGAGPGTTNVASLLKWDEYSFRSFTTTNVNKQDEIFLDPISYDDWRDGYLLGALRQVRTRPVAVAIAPDMSVCLGPVPNGNYTIEGDYWVTPQAFAVDADVPKGLPIQDHMIIVYEALKYYSAYESAPEVADRAETEFNKMFKRLESRFGPRVIMAASLA